MKKSDLEFGNVVETREGIKYLYHCKNSDKLLNLDYDSFLWIRSLDENLKCIDDLNELDIMKVYKDYTCKELLWERKEEPKTKPKLTEDEKAILRNVPKEYKYIARDESGLICLFTNKPFKGLNRWLGYDLLMFPFEHIFKFVKWEDDKPYSIEKLLGEEK